MVDFGLIDEWNPGTGKLTTWAPTDRSRRAAATAPIHSAPPSQIQRAYLAAAYRNRGSSFRFSRLCLVKFTIKGQLDRDAMTSAINEFVTRHDSFLSWFDTDETGSVRHLIDEKDVHLEPTDRSDSMSAAEIRQYVQDTTPGPDRWDCFSFGTIERDDDFTFYAAVDHLDTDGISQALTFYEIDRLYSNAVTGETGGLAPKGSYLEYCVREQAESAATTLETPAVQKWIDLVVDNGGNLPNFPLDLGRESSGYTRTAHSSFPLFDGPQADAVDEACERVGAKFIGGIFAAAALAEYELAGRSSYLGMTPKSTRSTPGEYGSIGWYSSLIPVRFDIRDVSDIDDLEPTFLTLAARAQKAFDAGKSMSNTSFHRVMELVTPEHGIKVQPGWTAPMISYVDVRKLPGADAVVDADAGLFGNRGSSEEVFMWINRFGDSTGAAFLYPGTDQAERAIDLYFSKISEIFHSVATFGDYRASTAVDDSFDRQLPHVSKV